MEKLKKFSKYLMNILAMINALIIGLSPIWGWNLDKITDSIAVVIGIIGLYLVGGKLFADDEQDNFNDEDLENIDTEGE